GEGERKRGGGTSAGRTAAWTPGAKGAAADGKIRRRIDRLDHRIYERRVVSRVYPEAVADGVVEARLLKIKLEVPCLLSRARLVQPGTRLKHGFDRIVARAATLGRRCGNGRAICNFGGRRWVRRLGGGWAAPV